MLSGLKKLFGQGSAGERQSPQPSAVAESLNRPAEKPKTSMSELVVHELIPVTQDNWPFVQSIMKKSVWQGGDPDLEQIFKLHAQNKEAVGSFEPCDNPKYPVLVGGETKSRIQMWRRRGMEPSGENLVLVQSNVVGTPEKVITFMPQQLVRGTKASFIMIFRMSCCADSSYSALVSLSDRTGEKSLCTLIDSQKGGIKEGMGANVFRNRIGVANTAQGQRQLEENYQYIQHLYETNKIPFPQ